MLYQNRVRLMVPFVKTKGNASEDSEGKLNKDAYESREYRSFQKKVKIIDDKENELRDAIRNAQDISPKTKENLFYPLMLFTHIYGNYNKTHNPRVLYAARQDGEEINRIWWHAKQPEDAAIVRFLHKIEPLVPELVRGALKDIPERYIQQREELSVLRRSEPREAFSSAFRKVDSGIKEVELFLLEVDHSLPLMLGTIVVSESIAGVLALRGTITPELSPYVASGLIAIYIGMFFTFGLGDELKDAWENETICW